MYAATMLLQSLVVVFILCTDGVVSSEMGTIFFTHSVSFHSLFQGIITSFPSDPVGCYGGVSTLYCGSNRSDIGTVYWKIQVNGITLSTEEQDLRNITDEDSNNSTNTATLKIVGISINNGIVIVCTAVTTSYDIEILSDTFTISDDIPPVDNINMTFTTGSVLLTTTWYPPSCIPIDHVYSVTITNTGDNTTALYNTTDTQLTHNVTSCNANYTLTVVVIDTESNIMSLPAVNKMYTENYLGIQLLSITLWLH